MYRFCHGPLGVFLHIYHNFLLWCFYDILLLDKTRILPILFVKNLSPLMPPCLLYQSLWWPTALDVCPTALINTPVVNTDSTSVALTSLLFSLAISAMLPPSNFAPTFPLLRNILPQTSTWLTLLPLVLLAQIHLLTKVGHKYSPFFLLQPSMRSLPILSSQFVPLGCYFLPFYNPSHLMCLLLFAPVFPPS